MPNLDNPEINIVSSEDCIMARLHGRFDIDSSPAIRDQLLALLHGLDANAVTIDFSAVTHIDSAGVATLIEALKVARGHSVQIKLRGLHDRLRTLFEVTGILPLFNGHANRAQSAKVV